MPKLESRNALLILERNMGAEILSHSRAFGRGRGFGPRGGLEGGYRLFNHSRFAGIRESDRLAVIAENIPRNRAKRVIVDQIIDQIPGGAGPVVSDCGIQVKSTFGGDWHLRKEVRLTPSKSRSRL